MNIKTRIAPSPTGYLHIGSARTAIFNYLFAKRNNGKFTIRIEDTDRERYYPEAITKIFDDLNWIGLTPDEIMESQFARKDRHIEIAEQLIKEGKAYYCYTTKEELTDIREKAKQNNKPFRFVSPWREKSKEEAPKDIPPVVRIKTPQEGTTIIKDEIAGEVEINNQEIEDFIIMRSDKTPIYNLSVTVDDHDMGITHIIRGTEHLNNAFKQKMIYEALGWEVPAFAHIPVILAPGKGQGKLSKRHGAVTLEDYKNDGFLPEAMFNYLLKLGWGHGDDEIISQEQAIKWFDLSGVQKSPAHFDNQKLISINGHYIREADNNRIFKLTIPFIEALKETKLNDTELNLIKQGIQSIKERVKTLKEAAEMSLFYITDLDLNKLDEKSKRILTENKEIIKQLIPDLEKINWDNDSMNEFFKTKSEKLDIKLGKLIQPFRISISYSTVSPPLFEAMEILGKDEIIKRLNLACK